jgi:hypothetical protein
MMILFNSNLHLYKRNFTLILFECYSSVIRVCNLYKGIYKSIYESIYKGSLKWKNFEIFLPLSLYQDLLILIVKKIHAFIRRFLKVARGFSRIIIIRARVMNNLSTN